MSSNGRRKAPPSGTSVLSSLPSTLSSRSQSLPQLQATPSQLASTSSHPSNEYANGGAGGATIKCRGEFCRVTPSTLRGLYGARPGQKSNDDPGDESDDSTNGNTPRRESNASDRDLVLQDDGRRFKIGNNNLLLAKAEMAFVMGTATRTTGKDTEDHDNRALQWQEADNVHRMELGRTNPSAFYKQVSVCRNCHRIYADIASFRERGFRWDATQKGAWVRETGTEKERAVAATGGGGMTKKKKKNERPRLGGMESVAAPEEFEDEALQYDRLFLDELAKHGDTDEILPWRQPVGSSARSEKEVEWGTKPAMLRASVDSLPSVTSLTGSSVAKKKKPSNMLLQSLERDDPSDNQQPSRGSRHELRSGGDNDTARLEAVIDRLRQDLASEQAAVKRVEAQRQLLEHKLGQNQTTMQEREDEFRKKLLEVELESMSKKLYQTHSQQSHGQSSSASEATSELIETIDSLNLQLHEANNAAEKIRRELLQTQQHELKRLHEKYQLEMEALRLSEYTAKEQTEAAHLQMNHWQNEAQVALSQAKSARAALDDLTKTRVPQLEERNQRLERQLTELKAKSTAAMVATSTAGANGAGHDVAAMEKHLTNKIDYLKAQLASEMKCKEELGSHLASITASMEALKKEKRTALADQEEAHKRHLERLASNVAQEKDVMIVQLASLQGKITTLQANVTDLVQELTMWKSREANSKLAVEKMAEENVRLTRQIVDLEGHIEALQDERKRDGSMGVKNANDETQRMQMEALLRRLDNERQYLKNQVDNEVELKVQSQQRVHSLEEEVCELTATTEELTKIAEHKISTLNAEKSHLERQLRDDKAILEESKLLLTRQLKEMQVKFLQTREQSLLDKDELEKARIELSDARSQLIAAKEETVKEKEYGKSANERMSKALATIKSSLKAMEEEKNLRIDRLDEENKSYMQKLAKTQGELLVLENKWSEDKQAMRRQQALARFLSVVSLRVENRCVAAKANAFYHFHCLTSVTKLRETLSAAHDNEMAERERELRQDFMDKCDELAQSLHAERVEALTQADSIRVREKEELQQYYEQERSQLEEDLAHIHARQLRELEGQYEQTLKTVDEKSAAALSALQRRCDGLEQERHEALTAIEEMRTKCDRLGASAETKQEIARTELVEQERVWQQEKESLVDRHTQELLELEQTAERRRCEQDEAHAEAITHALQVATERHTTEVDHLRSEFERERAAIIERLQKEHVRDLQDLLKKHVTDLEQEKQQVLENLQVELEQERAKHEKALKSALERVELKAQSHLETLQKDLNDRKANALLQCTAKWQNAMDDLQARLEIEKKVAYENGLQDRENEWQQAALQIKQKQKDELDSVQNEAVRAIQAAEERHRMLLQSQIAHTRKELEEKQRLDIEALRADILKSESARSQQELALALIDQEAVLLSRFNVETQNLREELTDDHQVDMKQIEGKWFHEKEELIRRQEQERLEAVKQVEANWATKLEQLCAEKEAELSVKVSEQEESLLTQLEETRQEMDDAFRVELDAKLKAQEERLLSDQEDAINQVQEDSERLIEQVEVAMGELKKQKEALETELTRLRSALEKAEDAHFDMEETLKKQQKSMAFQVLVVITQAKKTLDQGTHTHATQLMELQSRHDHLGALLQREQQQYENDLSQIRETWTQLQARHNEMLQTLTNYKRDELVAHRSASAVLSNEVSIVLKQMDEVSEMKAALEHEIAQLQNDAHGVEASLRQLMLQPSSSSSSLSAAGDGSLNMAVVAKKRRLNEEFEALLEQVERKKSEVRNIDKTLASLRQRREEKEGELKAMERKLVEILVGQQKQMLVLLNATREVTLPTALAPVTAS